MRYSHHILRCCVIALMACIGIALWAQPREAKSDTTAAKNRKTILVISAYHEDEPWGIKMMLPLNNHFMLVDSVDVQTTYMSNFTIDNRETYDKMADNLFERYASNPPECVILLGNFAFTLRDRIKEEWGDDTPFLVVARVEGVGKLEDYFTTSEASIEKRVPMSSFRDQYNFTVVLSPDYPKATIDLMMDLIPDMRELVFMADASYVNRVASYNIYNYLLEEYPEVKYKWLVSSQENSYEYRENLATRDPRRGLLVSSWEYDTNSLLGYPLLTTHDLSFIAASENPVFTLRMAFLGLGCVGGVFSDNDIVSNMILERTEMMLRGESMRDVPFFIPEPNTNHPVVDYRLLQKYDLNPKACPEDTEFRNRPQSLLERYGLIILLVSLIILSLIILLSVRNRLQSRQINVLKRHYDFIDNMPLPYCAIKVILNSHDRLVDIIFDVKNRAYDSLIANNTNPDDPIHLLPSKLVAQKTRELIDGRRQLSFSYHLECTDTFYEFMYFLNDVTTRDDGIKVVKIDVFARNVTDQHNMQENLYKASEHLEMAVEIANIVPWYLDWNTKVITREKEIHSIKSTDKDVTEVKYSMQEYMTRVHPDDKAIIEDALAKVDKLEVVDCNTTYRLLNLSTGEYDWVQNRMKVVETNDNGTVSKIVGTMRIITAEKEAETRLHDALDRARESDKMKSVFLANMSHEIRTPLNAIVGFSNLLVNLDEGEDKQEIIDVITHNNDLLLTLINDIIDLAKIESDNIDLAESDVDVESMLESIAKTIAVRLPKDVKLNIAHYADHLEAVLDPSRVTQVLINFLVNACKFTTQGSITLGVEKRDHNTMLYFYVKDTGIGIAPEDQDRVFERFLKLDQFSQGTGLGLAISKTLVEKMGGEIGVKSEGIGYGSTFWFTIPYRKPQNTPPHLLLNN